MLKKICLVTVLAGTLTLGVGYQQPVYASGLGAFGLLGGLFQSSVTAKEAYKADEFYSKVGSLMQNNPAKYDATIKGKGFLLIGQVEKITRLQLNNQRQYNSKSANNGNSIYYAVKIKDSNTFCVFDSGKAEDVGKLDIGQEIMVVGRADAAANGEVMTLSLFDCRIATDKDKEPFKKQLTPPPPQPQQPPQQQTQE